MNQLEAEEKAEEDAAAMVEEGAAADVIPTGDVPKVLSPLKVFK